MLDTSTAIPEWLQQMEIILEELNEGVVIVDDQLRVVFANEALIRLGKYERGELQGRSPDAIFPRKDLPYLVRQHESTHRYGRHRNEFYLPRKDGEKIPAIYSGRTIQGPDGHEYVVLTITDISAQKQIEEQLRKSNELLENRQREVEAELLLAARVQQSLAPSSLVWNNIAVEAYYSPAGTIGGDFGLVVPHGDTDLDLLVCDVSGHGISSALLANRIYTETVALLRNGTGLDEMLRTLNRFVMDQIGLIGFMFTMAAVRLDETGRKLSFAAAGHPPALLITPSGELRQLAPRSAVLGAFETAVPQQASEEFMLSAGDRLMLYSDGLTEVWNGDGQILDVEGLEKIVRGAAALPLPAMRQAIIEGVNSYSAGPVQDDVTLVLVDVR
jgi:PAS domain S-box-containing protein